MHGEYKMPGGKLVVADLSTQDGRIDRAQISGDFFLEPDDALHAINAAVCGLPADSDATAIAAAVEVALDAIAPPVSLYGVSAEAIAVAVRRALDGGVPA